MRSTIGSGIGARDIQAIVHCDTCGHETELDVYIDDRHIGWATCLTCGSELEIDWLYEPDPDEAYERWRDERDQHDPTPSRRTA